jgi:hypothetical protein
MKKKDVDGMRNVIPLSQLKIDYNAELRLLEKMVSEAMAKDDVITSREIILQSRKVDALLLRLIEEEGMLKTKRHEKAR